MIDIKQYNKRIVFLRIAVIISTIGFAIYLFLTVQNNNKLETINRELRTHQSQGNTRSVQKLEVEKIILIKKSQKSKSTILTVSLSSLMIGFLGFTMPIKSEENNDKGSQD